jgi:HSP90 family molecular chaperone
VSYGRCYLFPAKAPYDYYTRDYEPGLQLYSSVRHDNGKMPGPHPRLAFRFVRGVVDSPDLSRQHLARDASARQAAARYLEQSREENKSGAQKAHGERSRDKYEQFYKSFCAPTQIRPGSRISGRKRTFSRTFNLSDVLFFKGKRARAPGEYVKKNAGGAKIHLLRLRGFGKARRRPSPDGAKVKERGSRYFI